MPAPLSAEPEQEKPDVEEAQPPDLTERVEELQQRLISELHRGAEQLLLRQENLVRSYTARIVRMSRDAEGTGYRKSSGTKSVDDVTPMATSDKAKSATRSLTNVTSAFDSSEPTVPKVKSSMGLDQDYLTTVTHRRSDAKTMAFVERLTDVYKWWSNLEEPERKGRFARFVLSNRFEIVTLAMIMLNGLLVVWQTNEVAAMAYADPRMLPTLDRWSYFPYLAEHIFAAYFLIELVLRVAVHGVYFFINDDMWWNLFDAVTVVAGSVDLAMGLIGTTADLVDVTFLRVLRVFRMTRGLRLFRALHFIRHLRQLMDSIIASFSGLFWCLLLLVFVTGIFATFLVQCATTWWEESRHLDPDLADDVRDRALSLHQHFGSIGSSMVSLFKSTTGGDDWGHYYEVLKITGVMGPLILALYILFFIIAAWNIVTSLFIESALALAQPDMEQQMLARKRQDLADARLLLHLITTNADMDHSGTISCAEFTKMMQVPRIRDFFTFRNIDIKDAEMFFHMLEAATKTEEVQVSVVVNGIMRMRGVASNLDLQAVGFQIAILLDMVQKCLRDVKTVQKDLRYSTRTSAHAAHYVDEGAPPPEQADINFGLSSMGEASMESTAPEATPNRPPSMAMRMVQVDIESLGLSPRI